MTRWLKAKQVIIFLITLIPIVSAAPIAFAAEQNPALPIRVGYFDYSGLLELDSHGEYFGYEYDYLNEISHYTGWEYQFIYGTLDECLNRLKNGEIDLLCTIQYSPERAQLYDFSKYEAGTEFAALYVAKDNNTVFYEDFASFDGLKIGFINGSYQNHLFKIFANEHRFSYQSALFATAREAEDALANGKIDALLTGNLRKGANEKVVAKLAPTPFYFITTKGNTNILNTLNSALEKIQTTNYDFNTELFTKHYGASASRLAFTREEADYIHSNPDLTVAYLVSWPPVSSVDRKTGNYTGISHGILELISEIVGIHFTYLPVQSMEEAYQKMDSGEADFICGFPASCQELSKKPDLLITKPYWKIPIAIAKPANAPAEIATVAIPDHLPFLESYAKEQFPNSQIICYDDTESCLKAIGHQKACIVLDNAFVLYQYTKYDMYRDIEPIFASQTEIPVYIGVKSDDSILHSLFNKSIDQLDPNKINETVIANTMEAPDVHPFTLVKFYALPILLFIFLFIMLVLLRSKKEIERFAFIDPLTGQMNQTKFILSADKMLKSRGYFGYAVISLDIDNFKLINTMHSFETGNQILCATSKIIAQNLQPYEFFCRESNDNFIILLSYQDETAFRCRLDQIIHAIVAIPHNLGIDYQYTVSCGVYPFIKLDDNIHKAIGWASLARKRTKAHHQNRIAYYDDSMREKATKAQQIENKMEHAIQNREFQVYYQPKYQLNTESIAGAEALVRWIPPDGNMIYPDEFIPLFESNGFILQLDLYVFEEVCRKLQQWINEERPLTPISVNLSRVHLNHPNFYEQYLRIMEKYQIPTRLIELELTESTIFENKDQLVTLMYDLKNAGLSISMDDFGTGYSSLNLLKDMPIDFLKLDREFFNLSSDSDRGKKIIQSIVYMASQLKIIVVAEGVENKEQVEFLKSIHCDIVQGYYYSKPLSVEDFEALLFSSSKKGRP